MTIYEVLSQVDELKPNTIDDSMKIGWLSELDGKIFHEVILTHEHEEDIEYNGHTDTDEELLVKPPYTDIYRNYIFAMIDLANAESDRYQMSYSLFMSSYKDFTSEYNRTHMPIHHPLQLL